MALKTRNNAGKIAHILTGKNITGGLYRAALVDAQPFTRL
jgi:hypothetical protein